MRKPPPGVRAVISGFLEPLSLKGLDGLTLSSYNVAKPLR